MAEDVNVEWTIAPRPLAEVNLRDARAGRFVGPGSRSRRTWRIPESPVVATVAERDEGIDQIGLRFTMPGGWILLATGGLPDEPRIDHRIDVNATGPSG